MSPLLPGRQRGGSLIEVLVALLVLAVGLLGLAALQARSLSASLGSAQRSEAIVLSQYLLDVMRLDRDAVQAGAYATGGPRCTPDPGGPGGLAQATLPQWLGALQAQLGRTEEASACATIHCRPDAVCQVEIEWPERPAAGVGTERLALEVRL